MNQETIPDNNLPVYFQKYNVRTFNDKKESVGTILYISMLVPLNLVKKVTINCKDS